MHHSYNPNHTTVDNHLSSGFQPLVQATNSTINTSASATTS
jgi:hypothetical protein